MLRGTTVVLGLILVSAGEVLRDLPGMEGKAAAVLGRYSYRHGLWIGEQDCGNGNVIQTFAPDETVVPKDGE